MAQGLGAFTEGLQGGIKARTDMDYAKQRKRYMADKSDRADRLWNDEEVARSDTWDQENPDKVGQYVQQSRTKTQDPALLRLGKFVGGRIKGFFGGKGGEDTGALQTASFVSPEIAAPVQQPTSAIPQAPGTGGIPGQTDQFQPSYADGGLVRAYANGGEVEDDEDYDAAVIGAGGTAAAAYGIGRHGDKLSRVGSRVAGSKLGKAAGKGGAALAAIGAMQGAAESGATDTDEYRRRLEGGIPGVDTRRAGPESQTLDEAMAAADEQHRGRGTPNPWSAGGGIRDDREAGGEGDWWHWRNAAGFAKDLAGGEAAGDVGVRAAGTMMDVGNKYGFGDSEGGIPAAEASNESDVQAAGAAIDASDTSSKDIADAAMSDGEQLAVENLDYQLLAEQGVSPDDLPSMNTKDWGEYRSHIFNLSISQGMGVKEAYEQMDSATVDMQMKGMMREMDKANIYLQGGNNEAAALALRQGYQYFPNGVDVKFGTAVDPKTGQPAIITMGYDEETGKETGKAFLITSERLAAMRENFTDPKAFRSWTKDGHDLQIEISKMQSQDDYRQGTLDINAYRAETEREDMIQSGIPGQKSSDRDRRAGIYTDRLEMISLNNPMEADHLKKAMAEYEQFMRTDTEHAIAAVMSAYGDDGEGNGDIRAVDELMMSLGQE